MPLVFSLKIPPVPHKVGNCHVFGRKHQRKRRKPARQKVALREIPLGGCTCLAPLRADTFLLERLSDNFPTPIRANSGSCTLSRVGIVTGQWRKKKKMKKKKKIGEKRWKEKQGGWAIQRCFFHCHWFSTVTGCEFLPSIQKKGGSFFAQWLQEPVPCPSLWYIVIRHASTYRSTSSAGCFITLADGSC